MPSLGAPELIIILVVVVIIFWVGRLPEVGGALGKGIKEFRKSAKGSDEEEQEEEAASAAVMTSSSTEAPAATPQPAAKSEQRNS